jgi:arylsulfatase
LLACSRVETDKSPRKGFVYVNDDGDIVAVRWEDWKVVYEENRGKGFGVWREPFTELRVPLLFNLRRDPFERAQHNANVYEDWALDRVFILFGANKLAAQFLETLAEYPPSQTPGSFNLSNVQKKIQQMSTTEN